MWRLTSSLRDGKLALLVPFVLNWSCGGEVSDGASSATKNAGGGTSATTATGGHSSSTGGRAVSVGGASAISSGGATATGGVGASAGSDAPSAGASGAAVAGSAATAGGSAAGGVAACSCGSPDCGVCPEDKSVLVDAGEHSYRIDATEVTNFDYAAFVAANPGIMGQPLACAWNGSFVPLNNWPATGQENFPVVWVDWCDAYAYCKWAKKRLCGKIGGGELSYSSTRDAESSQWYRACSNSGALPYPYGPSYDPERCNGKDRTVSASQAWPAASQPSCQGGLAGLYDMSGNVWEWEDSCATQEGATDSCRLRGGSFWSETSLMDCPTATESYTRASVNKNIGFRCCRDE